jgi:rhodanese-related sulfurtransferase
MTTTGSQLGSFDPGDSFVKDLAFDGTYLWMINSIGTIKKFTTGGTLVDSIVGLLTNGWGLTWQNVYLWASDPDKDTIYQIAPYVDISPDSVKAWIESGADLVLLDVREPYEFESIGRIPNAVNMPWNSGVLDTAYVTLSVDDEIIVYCGSGYRSALASAFLVSKGFQHIYNMVGGFNDWHYSAEVGGHVSVNATWQTDKSPYMAVEDVTLDSSITLTVQAGVSVKFDDSCAVFVHGILVAQGTANTPVTITRADSTGHFQIVIEGTIDADYVNFEYFDSSGVNIVSTATIEKLNHTSFLNDDIPETNSFLQLTSTNDTLRLLTFNGGTPGEDCNITLHGDGTLTVYGYEGDFGGEEYDCPGDGEIIWVQAVRGDANGDGEINIADVVYLVNYLFTSGPAPVPLEAGDANCDAVINIADVIYLVNYLFIGGPPPGC